MLVTGPAFLTFAQQTISLELEGVKSDSVHLVYHLGSKQYIKQKIYVNEQGKGKYTFAEPIDSGIYIIAYGKQYAEFLNNGTSLTISFNLEQPISTMSFKGSPENELFYETLRARKRLNESLADLEENDPEREKLIADYETYFDELFVIAERDGLKSSMTAALYEANKEPEIPPAIKDKEARYRYFKKHFWDNYNFSIGWLVRTPIWERKMMRWSRELTVQHPDSITESIDYVISRVAHDKEMYKFTVMTYLSYYSKQKWMGAVEVYFHLVKQHYMSGKAYWADEKTIEKFTKAYHEVEPIFLGNVARNITMNHADGSVQTLHSVSKGYTVVFFWDTKCGGCGKVAADLNEVYDELKQLDTEVISLATNLDVSEVPSKVEEYAFKWKNTTDPFNRGGFREAFNIKSTPVLFLLDKENRIIGKYLTVEQILEFVQERESGSNKP